MSKTLLKPMEGRRGNLFFGHNECVAEQGIGLGESLVLNGVCNSKVDRWQIVVAQNIFKRFSF